MLKFPNWKEVDEQISNAEIKFEKLVESFKTNHPVLNKALRESFATIPEPFSNVAIRFYDGLGENADIEPVSLKTLKKAQEIFEQIKKISDLGEERYELLISKLNSIIKKLEKNMNDNSKQENTSQLILDFITTQGRVQNDNFEKLCDGIDELTNTAKKGFKDQENRLDELEYNVKNLIQDTAKSKPQLYVNIQESFLSWHHYVITIGNHGGGIGLVDKIEVVVSNFKKNNQGYGVACMVPNYYIFENLIIPVKDAKYVLQRFRKTHTFPIDEDPTPEEPAYFVENGLKYSYGDLDEFELKIYLEDLPNTLGSYTLDIYVNVYWHDIGNNELKITRSKTISGIAPGYNAEPSTKVKNILYRIEWSLKDLNQNSTNTSYIDGLFHKATYYIEQLDKISILQKDNYDYHTVFNNLQKKYSNFLKSK